MRDSAAVMDCQAPVSLYRGRVMHARLKPFGHRFFYRVFSILIDLDRLDEAGRVCRLFSVNRFNLVAFYEKDHGSGNGGLSEEIIEICRSADLPLPARVLLSAFPRVMGYVFNPLSVYFLYDRDGRIYGHVYEVRNTFGGKHTYVEHTHDEGAASHEAKKLFHVSPFLPKDLFYHFTVPSPGEVLRFRIVEKDGAGDVTLTALYSAKRAPMNAASLLKEGFGLPFMTLKIILGIHWQAVKLFFKGARLYPDFKRPSSLSSGGRYLPLPSNESDRTSVK